ncbi:polyketide synthase dehydratase domain-containing protein, partial [Streptomyces sp. NPDC048225]|uniref:polyketide synthase dehydratase domain-containing protein n=1 Tax=Streptomyces sp. NPDC048225 TaxID=3365518 RepID=UPI0037206403
MSHAFHSSHMDGVLEEFRGVVRGLGLSDPVVPLVSTVTGAVAGPGELTDPEYWVRQLRGTVRFHDAVQTMKEEGVGLCLEVGPDAVLTGMIRDGQDDGALTAVPLLRARHPETDVLAAGLATAHVHGARVDWAAFLPGAAPTDLPTYAFRHHRYWLPSGKRTEGRAAGTDRSWHPLLDTSVDLADRGDTVLGGRVDAEAHPWLADHAIDGNVILPATAFLELGAAVAARTGADRVEQLTLEAPLHLPEGEAAQLQIIVEAAGQDGARAFSVHARPAGQDGEDTGWTRCASGSLVSTGAGPEPDVFAPLRSWPPQGATEIPLDGVYDRLAELGYAYGPTFQGLTRLWRRGEELYAEVGLPTQLHDAAAAFAVHPALLDAAIQPLVVTASETLASEDLLRLPFDWQGAAFWNTGAPTALRVRITPAGGDDVSVAFADQHGAPVAQARALTMRPVSRESFTARFGVPESAAHALRWESVGPGLVGGGVSGGLVFVGEGLPGLPEVVDGVVGAGAVVFEVPSVRAGDVGVGVGGDVAGGVRGVVGGVLGWLRGWLGDGRFEGLRLVVVTRGAVAAVEGEGVVDLGGAAVWGLVRSARAEFPGRLVLADVEEGVAGSALGGVLESVVGSGLDEVAVRGGRLLAPRLVPAPVSDPASALASVGGLGGGTVVVSGATGTLGRVVARHLVVVHGVR